MTQSPFLLITITQPRQARVAAQSTLQCKDLNIGFTVLPVMNESSRGTKRTAEGQFVDNEKSESTFRGLLNLIRSLRVAALITDFSPLREDTAAIQTVSQMLPSNTSFFQVDAHNIVPAWYASDKLEYAARTIRRKLHEKSQTLLTEFPPVRAHPIPADAKVPSVCFFPEPFQGVVF
ncbi:unnamed protein product [Schistocephalus solidus]|uniref:Photolyase/cryptochrome alpha/beta domain-containing protein n=1 Tax=Schistocephalus solidus TaxID=70667 RepID=A0A183TPY6_SCHSO|nr:unnamed protein product [Schistocephalus solidus]